MLGIGPGALVAVERKLTETDFTERPLARVERYGLDKLKRQVETLKPNAHNLSGPVGFKDLFPLVWRSR